VPIRGRRVPPPAGAGHGPAAAAAAGSDGGLVFGRGDGAFHAPPSAAQHAEARTRGCPARVRSWSPCPSRAAARLDTCGHVRLRRVGTLLEPGEARTLTGSGKASMWSVWTGSRGRDGVAPLPRPVRPWPPGQMAAELVFAGSTHRRSFCWVLEQDMQCWPPNFVRWRPSQNRVLGQLSKNFPPARRGDPFLK